MTFVRLFESRWHVWLYAPDHKGVMRLVAVCTSREAAEAAQRLMGGAR